MRYVQQNGWLVPLCFDFLRKTRTIKAGRKIINFKEDKGIITHLNRQF